MSDNVLSLDFLLEPVKPAGVVTLLGKEYKLFQADVMENFLTLVAMAERASAEIAKDVAQPGEPEQSVQEKALQMAARVERLRADLRTMIRVLVPEFSEDLLIENFPKMEQLQGLFSTLLMEVQKTLPESVKKNSGGTSQGTTAKTQSI